MSKYSKLPCTYSLDKQEKLIVRKLIENNIPNYNQSNFDEFMKACFHVSLKLPKKIIDWSLQVRENNIGLIKNLPLEELIPNTPTVRYELDSIPMFSDSVLSTISALFGYIYTFKGKFTIRHIHNIYPALGDENSQLGYSKGELEWHVEDGFHNDRADWIGLLCLRGNENAKTKIARSKDILEHSVLPNVLFKPYFNLRFDDSFDESMQSTLVKTSVFNKVEDNYEIIFDPFYTVCEDDEAAKALHFVKEIAEIVHQEVILEPGDAVFFNNKKTIHSRTAFSPKMKGSDRWLKRVLVLEKPSPQTQLINGTII